MGCTSTQVGTGKFPIQHRQGVRSGTVHHAVDGCMGARAPRPEWLHRYSGRPQLLRGRAASRSRSALDE